MLERPERLASRRRVLLLLAAAALFCCLSRDWKAAPFSHLRFLAPIDRLGPGGRYNGAVYCASCWSWWRVLVEIRTVCTVRLVVSCVDGTVRMAGGFNLVGCRGRREQSMVGPHQGAALNLAGHIGASKNPALLAISCCCCCNCTHCTTTDADLDGLAAGRPMKDQRVRFLATISIWDVQLIHGLPQLSTGKPTCRAQKARTKGQFLPSPKQGQHRTCRVRAKQSLFQGYFL